MSMMIDFTILFKTSGQIFTTILLYLFVLRKEKFREMITGSFQIIIIYISRIILTPKVKMHLKYEFSFLISKMGRKLKENELSLIR